MGLGWCLRERERERALPLLTVQSQTGQMYLYIYMQLCVTRVGTAYMYDLVLYAPFLVSVPVTPYSVYHDTRVRICRKIVHIIIIMSTCARGRNRLRYDVIKQHPSVETALFPPRRPFRTYKGERVVFRRRSLSGTAVGLKLYYRRHIV